MPKGVGGKKKLKFRTTKNMKTRKNRIIGLIFVFVTIIVATISIVVLLHEYDFKGLGKDEPTSEGEQTTAPVAKLADEVTVMFSGVSTSKDQVMFISLITLNTKDREFEVCNISPDTQVDGNTLTNIYVQKGDEELESAVAIIAEKKVDRYVVVTEKRFKSFMGALGSYEVNLPAKIDFSNGEYSLNLLAGKQTLTGDKLFKYIMYKGEGGANPMKAQAEVIADLVSQKLNEVNTAKGEDLFGTLVNNSKSNITILDFSKYHELLKDISKEPRHVSVIEL